MPHWFRWILTETFAVCVFCAILIPISDQTIPLELRKAIQQARQRKNMSQADLAQKLAEKASLVNEYESGKAIPNNTMIAKMERALDCKLPRPPKVKKIADEE
jgi:ribosome-binding protein aMBF1 (putative translation factor)